MSVNNDNPRSHRELIAVKVGARSDLPKTVPVDIMRGVSPGRVGWVGG